MDDNKTNQGQNQPPMSTDPNYPQQAPTPLYETETVPDVPQQNAAQNFQTGAPVPLQPEEVPAGATAPEDVFSSTAAPEAISGDEPPPIYEEGNKTKYFFIGGGVIFFILIFILFLSLLLGGKPKKPVQLTYWMLWEDSAVFDPLIKDYEKQNPNVKITVQKMSIEDYKDKLVTRISQSGTPTDKAPDMFRFHNTWLPEIKDVVAPLPKSIMSDQDFQKTFYAIQAKDLKMGQSFYGIPLEIDGLVLIYNDGLFKKSNVDKPPSNLDELIDDKFLSKFTFKDSSNQLKASAVALGTTSNVEHFSDIFGLLLLQNGGDLHHLDDPVAAGALEGYRKFAEVGVWDDTMPNSIAAFAQEKVAMIIAPSWEIINIKAQNPDIQLKVAPIPFNLPGNQPVSLANYWAEGVSKKSPNSLEAWKFLKFLSEKDSETKLFAEESKTRLFGEPYSRVDLADKLVTNPYLGVVIQQADHYYSLPLISNTGDKGLNDSIIGYIQNAINSTAQGVSYSDALSTAKQGVDQIYSQYNIQ